MFDSNEFQNREKVRSALKEYFHQSHSPRLQREFIAGETYVPVSGRVYDVDDMLSLAESCMDFWLTTGRFARQFESEIAKAFSRPASILVNSGSSANLLALASICAQGLKERRLLPGDEVITVAAGFPTTVSPLVQYGLVPVFVDVELQTYNTTAEKIEAAISDKTKAIMIAHTLGNPFRADLVAQIARKHNLFLIEDCCDALGATIQEQPVGSFGDLATVSFYPAHHITMGEGGAVMVKNGQWKRIAESIRDWGRDCWCDPGKDNTCKKRFGWELGNLPKGYDHKYVYSEIGYNLKATDMQAAVGLSQIKKLPEFIEKRRKNFDYLTAALKSSSIISEKLLLPKATEQTNPSWFGYPVLCRKGIPRDKVVEKLESMKVGTRLLFSGNIVKQPAYQNIKHRIAEPLTNTEQVMTDVFWLGVYPGLTPKHLDYVVDCLEKTLGDY
ncbi:MAG: lipopolysaccharide biosynthesis protein RfbH [Bacteriovoracia bacterium]